MKKILSFLLASVLILPLSACSSNNGSTSGESSNTNSSTTEKSDSSDVLKVGASPRPHAEILEFIKPKLEEKGVKLDIVEFTDYVTPNLALNDKEIDANFFQHIPYMESFAKDHNLDLVSVGTIHVEPLGLYSSKIDSIDTLPDGATIAIPNDPTNAGRSLILLENNGLIKLKKDAGLEATSKDIAENPKNLKFKEIDAAQIPRVLPDVDAAVINVNYILETDLDPAKDALIIEGSESPYANIVTTRPDNKDSDKIKTLIDVLQSEDVKNFISETYKGIVVPAF